ncbi:MAG: hypothetical protein LV479_00960 [Methylacidiphilales bacterium]|nr:hypothetical protein [Candidatus Methylacidiphilales bacterium]
MSDEHEISAQPYLSHSSGEPSYSAFWPLLILISGFLLWSGYQVWVANSQRSILAQQLDKSMPTIKAAEEWHERYNTLIKDLEETGSKDPAAAPLAKAALQAGLQAGLIRVNPQGSGSTDASTAATPTPTPGQ